MIGKIEIRVSSHSPQFPLRQIVAFKDSASSIRIMEVPKAIGDWKITSVSLLVRYPDNTTVVKEAVRTGCVYVATIRGSGISGKVSQGYEILASGIDEDGNEVSNYVLGCGDVVVLDRDVAALKDIEKFYVKYSDELPTTPAKGDLVCHNGVFQMFNGLEWIKFGIDQTVIEGIEEKIDEVDAKVDEVDGKIDEVDAKLYNKRDYFNIQYPTTPDRDSSKYGIYNPDLIVNGQVIVLDDFLFNMDGSSWKSSDGAYRLNTKNGLDFTVSKNGVVIHAFSRTLDKLNINERWIDAQNIPYQLISVMLFSHLALQSEVSKEIEVTEERVMAAMPEKTSDIENDSGYITSEDVPEVPTKTSELENDSGYITQDDVPTKTSELENDSGYITSEDVPEVPTKTSELENDSEFVDRDFVNSSIATNTANFKGTFTSAEGWPTEATNNDYLFWRTVDENGNVIYRRYKYIASTSTWTYEYTLNNSSFTAQQWATINGGPYATQTSLNDKQDKLPYNDTWDVYDVGCWSAVNATRDVNGNQIDQTYATKAELPTKTSELENDSGYSKVVESTDAPGWAENAVQAGYAETASYAYSAQSASTAYEDSDGNNISETYAKKTELPTKTSELENDSNFLSATKTADGYYNIDVDKAYMAENDVMGNPITTTYAKKSELDANTMTLAGEYEDQTPFSFVVYIKNY